MSEIEAVGLAAYVWVSILIGTKMYINVFEYRMHENARKQKEDDRDGGGGIGYK